MKWHEPVSRTGACGWILTNFFEPQITRQHLDRLMSRKHVNKYAFRRFHFIDRQDFAGSWYWLNYSSGHDRVMWRENASGYFQNLVIDSPNVKGIKGLKINTDIRLKHLGYINKELVDKKADIYRAIIPEKEAALQTMYLQNEKRVRWIDDRSSLKVIMLNRLLDIIRLSHLFPKMYRKVKGILHRKQKAATINPVSAVS